MFSIALFAPAAPSSARFPGIAFAHGMRGLVAAYSGTLSHLASHGFLVAAPRGSRDFTCPACTFQQLETYVADMADTAAWLAASAQCDATRGVGLMGHSLGGGTAVLAAARAKPPLRIAGIVALAPAEGNICKFAGGPGSDNSTAAGLAQQAATAESAACIPHAAAAALQRVPLLILAGERDRACPIAVNARRVFAAARAPATLHIMRAGTHCASLRMLRAQLKHDAALRLVRCTNNAAHRTASPAQVSRRCRATFLAANAA